MRIPDPYFRNDSHARCESCDAPVTGEPSEHRSVSQPLTLAQIEAAQPTVDSAEHWVPAGAEQVLLVEVYRCECGAEVLGYLAADCVRCGGFTESTGAAAEVCAECRAEGEPEPRPRPRGCFHSMGCDC